MILEWIEKSIFREQVIATLFVVFISLGIFAGFAMRQQQKQLEDQIETSHKGLAKLMGTKITTSYRQGTIPYHTLSDLNEREDIAYWFLVKSNNEVYQSSHPHMIGKTLDIPHPSSTLVKTTEHFENGGRVKMIVEPLDIEDGRYFVMGSSLDTIDKAKASLLRYTGLIFLISFILSFIVVYYVSRKFTRRITGPLKDLTEAAEKVSKGSLNVDIDVDREDEIGALADSIKRLVSTIKILQGRDKPATARGDD